MLRRANVFAARFARRNGLLKLGGSDSHTLAGLGRTFTEVPGARTPEEFLAGLRAGWSRVCGESGNYWKLTADVLDISVSMIRENPWTALLAPLWAAVPLVTLGNLAIEIAFAQHWSNRMEGANVRVAAAKAAVAG